MPSFLTTPVPHSEGAAFIREKPAVTRAIFDALAPELQAKAFVITGVEALDCVARVRDLTSRLPEGGDFDELKDEILAELSPWLITSTDPEERGKQLNAAKRRAELLLRMHGWQAYARTQDAMITANEDVFPYCQYLTSNDDRVRPSHAALNNKIFPTNHPFWRNHTPPWEFNCRCDKVPMSQEEVDEIRADETKKPAEDQLVMGPAQLREVEENGRIVKPGGQGFLDIRTPRERNGTGYEWRPAEDSLSIDQILARFTDQDRKAFEAYAAAQRLDDGRTLLDWWKPSTATASPAIANVPAPVSIPAPVPAAPAPAARQAPVSAALDVKARGGQVIKEAISVIDSVHDDGALPRIPLTGNPGPRNSGQYEHYSNGRPAGMKVRVLGPWPKMTTAHEIGHFIDHAALGTPGKWESQTPGPLASIIAALEQTPTWQRIRREAGPNSNYYQRPRETWARAYAQFIASSSQDPDMLKELEKIRTSPAPWRQWPDDEFLPILDLIANYFKSLSWM